MINNQTIDVKCYCCNENLGKPNFKTFVAHFCGAIENGRKKLFCNEKCYNKYWERFKVCEYNNAPIFQITIDGNNKIFLPYVGCSYGFDSLEDCQKRLDAKNIGIYNSKVLSNIFDNY